MKIAYPNILLDGLENGVVIIDENMLVHYWNLWMEINTGIKADDIMQNNLKDYFNEIDYDVLLRKIRTSLRLESPTFYSGSGNKKFMTINRHKVTSSSLNTIQLKVTITPYAIEKRQVMLSIYDVSEMQEAKLSLQKEITKSNIINNILEQDKKIIDHNLMILKMDVDCIIIESTLAFRNFFNHTSEELTGKTAVDMCDISVVPTFQDDIRKIISNKKTWRGEIQSNDIKGQTYWLDAIITPFIDENGEIINVTAIYHDISDKKRIEELSVTDPLTKLYNRLRFNDVIDQLILNHRKTDKMLSIILIDIDNFKEVNDTFGHQVGDYVLIEIANLLKESVRDTDLVARWGGEEFIILLPEIDIKTSVKVAEKIRKNVESHIFKDVGTLTCSFGVTQHMNDDTKEKMFSRADIALYKAKNTGKNAVVIN